MHLTAKKHVIYHVIINTSKDVATLRHVKLVELVKQMKSLKLIKQVELVKHVTK